MAKSPAASPFLAGFEPTTFRLGGGRSILLSYRNIFDFSCIFKAFRPSRIRSLARKSSKTSNENRLIRGGCFITPITPSLELSLIFVPQSVRIERPSCFSGSSESFVKNVLRRRTLYPAELQRQAFTAFHMHGFPRHENPHSY